MTATRCFPRSAAIAQYIAAHPDDAETALDLFMIAKYLERLGDHAASTWPKWVEFLKTGVHKSRQDRLTRANLLTIPLGNTA